MRQLRAALNAIHWRRLSAANSYEPEILNGLTWRLMAGQRAGSGLDSLRERLATWHGEAAMLTLENTILRGATATLEVPYARA